jgi:hypothetical protein
LVRRLTGEDIKALAHREIVDPGVAIRGDRIIVMCQKHGPWHMTTKSGQHRGWYCTAEKDAFAVVSGGLTRLGKKPKSSSSCPT